MIDGPELFVATGNTVKMAPALALDDVGGRWVAVTKVSGTCREAPSDYWEIVSLVPPPDGSLTGERSYISYESGCQGLQQVTLTRTGENEAGVSVADPTTQPPRKASPAQALHGRYHETRTYKNGPAETDYVVRTQCLRTGERCISWFDSEGKDASTSRYEYSDGRWVRENTPYDSTRANGGAPSRYVISLQIPLPQPPQDPITLLTGRGHYNRTGECAFDSDFESRLTRTGD